MKQTMKVAADSKPRQVAGAITHALNESSTVEIQAIGASAVNQSVKALAIARGYLAQEDRNIYCVPSFCTVTIEGRETTAIKLSITESVELIKSA